MTETQQPCPAAPYNGGIMHYTTEQVSAAINRAADDIQVRSDWDETTCNLMSLIVNAALTYLDDPAASLDDVAGCFAADDERTPAEVIASYLPR